MPPMTASELARMIEGWPEGARPAFYGWEPQGHWFFEGDRDEQRMSAENATDLACMAGLRWLVANAVPGVRATIVLNERADPGVSTLRIGLFEERFDGPSTLHAVDLAIRASIPSAPVGTALKRSES